MLLFPGELYQPLLIGRLLPFPTPGPALVYGVFAGLLAAAAVAATGRLPRLAGTAVALLYLQWMLIAMSYGKVDHDRFGLLVALAEACFSRGLGARVEVPLEGAALFSESQGRALVACAPDQLDRLLRAAESFEVPAREIGELGGETLAVRSAGETLEAPVAELREIWTTALPRALGL